MGKLYTDESYNQKMKEVDKSVVDLLIDKTEPYLLKLYIPTKIDEDTVQYDIEAGWEPEVAESGRVEAENLAIHYGKLYQRTPPIIIDEKNSIIYEIFPKVGKEEKIITRFKGDSFRIFYDAVKIHNTHIWKGTVEDLLEEFKKAGFTIKKNLSIKELDKYIDKYHDENPILDRCFHNYK